jgi:hypothetical protein
VWQLETQIPLRRNEEKVDSLLINNSLYKFMWFTMDSSFSFIFKTMESRLVLRISSGHTKWLRKSIIDYEEFGYRVSGVSSENMDYLLGATRTPSN